MTKHAQERGQRFRRWLWPAGWCLAGLGTLTGDVFSRPSDAPLWTAFALGALGWGAAGGLSARGGWPRRAGLGLVWAAIFVASLDTGMRWGNALEAQGRAGFVGLVGALGLGGGVGGIATLLMARGRSLLRAISLVPIYAALFALGAGAAVVSGYVLLAVADQVLDPLVGDHLSALLAWGLGWSAGGAIAGQAVRLAEPSPTAGRGAGASPAEIRTAS